MSRSTQRAIVTLLLSFVARAPLLAQDADLQSAIGLFQRGLYWGAEPKFRAVVKRNPNDPQARFGLAMSLYKSQRTEASIEHFAAAEQLPRPQAQYYSFHAEALETLTRLEEAKAALAGALRIEPEQIHATYLRGAIAVREGRFADARPDLEAVLAKEPGRVEAALDLAEALFRLGEDAEARARLERLMASGTRSPRVYYLLLTMAQKAKDRNAARKHMASWKAALAADEERVGRTKKVQAYFALAFQELEAQRIDKAVPYFFKVLEVEPANTEAIATLRDILSALERAGRGDVQLAAAIRSRLP